MLVLLQGSTFDEGHIRILEDWSFRSRLVDFNHRNLPTATISDSNDEASRLAYAVQECSQFPPRKIWH
jgi:hypothetical protein